MSNEIDGFPVPSGTDPAERLRCPLCGHLDPTLAMEARLDAEEEAGRLAADHEKGGDG